MKVVVRLDGREDAGGSALVLHNERLQDPLDPFQQAVAELAGKRGKTLADHLEIGRREFLGGLYTNGNGPCLPTMNVLRCVQEGGKRHKLGKDVLRGMFPLVEDVDILYEGPRDPDEMWNQADKFSLRKGVVVSGRRVTRTRPIFRNWGAEVPFEIDAHVFNLETVEKIVTDAGKYAGLGEMRPIYGRFFGTVLSEDEWLRQVDGDIDSLWAANRSSIERVLREDESRRTVNGRSVKSKSAK